MSAHSQASRRRPPEAGVSAAVFLSLLAGQAGLIAVTPVLTDVASALHVSTSAVGQLRTASGLAAGVTALALGWASRRLGLRELLLAGSGLLGAGAVASAVAPGFAYLLAAQVPLGIGVAALVTAGTAAAAAWVPRSQRARVLSWALAGQAAAWVVGMPTIGLVGDAGWRYAWLAVPLPAAAVAAVAVARRPHIDPAHPEGSLRAALADRQVARWTLGEVLVGTGWGGTLVFAGALVADAYGATAGVVGVVLAGAGAAYVAGNLTFRRLADTQARPLATALGLSLSGLVAIFLAVKPGLAFSAAVLSAAGFVAGGRTLAGSGYGLSIAAGHEVAVMGLRAAAIQLGYFAGSAAGGAALAAWGYSALGVVLGGILAAAPLAIAPYRSGDRRRLGRRGRPSALTPQAC